MAAEAAKNWTDEELRARLHPPLTAPDGEARRSNTLTFKIAQAAKEGEQIKIRLDRLILLPTAESTAAKGDAVEPSAPDGGDGGTDPADGSGDGPNH